MVGWDRSPARIEDCGRCLQLLWPPIWSSPRLPEVTCAPARGCCCGSGHPGRGPRTAAGRSGGVRPVLAPGRCLPRRLSRLDRPGVPRRPQGLGGVVRRPGRAPFAARRHHVDTWVKFLGRDPQPATGRPAAPATVARWLSCLSRFYDYGMREIELIEHSPVANVRRPKVSEDSPTISPPRTATVSHGEHRHRRAGRPLAGTRRVHHYHHRHRHPHRVRRHRPTLVAEDSYIAPGDSFLTDTPN
jgi:hypothetical protein